MKPQHIETHCSHIFLIGDRAFKLKRPIAFSYLDYSTLEARERCIRAELELNRRTAPQLYLACHKIVRSADGGLALVSPTDPAPALDWILEMRRFPDDALLADRADRGQLTTGQMRDLADAIHDLHQVAAQRPDHGGAAEMARVLDECIDNLRLRIPPLEARAVEDLARALDLHFAGQVGLLDRRRQLGAVRQCHGDLHLGNICLVDEHPVLFDCIDFSDMLACTDIAYDIAFLLMDLCHRRRVDFANLVLNRWLDRNGDTGSLALMPFFQSLRAAIRAHIVATTHRDDLARSYLASAFAHLHPAQPQLVAIGGPSGSGKSTLAMGLAPEFQPLPGARIIRSDTLRKRLAGVAPETRLPATSYTQEISDQVYAAMQAEARVALAAGYAVILDAAFLRLREREAVAALTREMGIAFRGFWLDVPEPVLRARLDARRGDASDADTAVLTGQLAHDPGPITWQRVAVGGDPAQNLIALRLALAAA
ncbi:MAG TPA: AAA family ATPase [Dongiaceae bacterium]|nr:AAA family ATPase [Dongiaceae bacterium]